MGLLFSFKVFSGFLRLLSIINVLDNTINPMPELKKE
jgi:hypothetical protein